MRLFEALGGWVATVPELDVKMRLGTHCYHHAWHAELWHKRLPELREMNPDRLTVPANDEMVALRRRDDRARGARADDREARRRLPRADPAQDRRVHVPPQQHDRRSPTRRRSARSSSSCRTSSRTGATARCCIQSLIETARRGRAGRRPPGAAREADGRRRRHRRPRLDRRCTPAAATRRRTA